MHDVIIFRPTKSAMQSGRLHRDIWNLVFQPPAKGHVDSCMHWTSQKDTCQEVILRFSSREKSHTLCTKTKIALHCPRHTTLATHALTYLQRAPSKTTLEILKSTCA